MTTPGHRRRSRVPGMYTRAELEADLGVSTNELDTLERQKIIVASERRQPGDTRPVLFSTADVAIARFAQGARRFGLRGEQLREVTARLATKRRRLLPGWAGWVVLDDDGDIELVGPGASLDAVMTGAPRSLLAVHIEVPSDNVEADMQEDAMAS